MKKYLFVSFALVLGLCLNGFSIWKENKKFAVRYLIFQSGAQTVIGNYSTQATQPSTCNFAGWLCWIRVNDTNNDGTISQSELDSFFATYDTNHDASLDDEDEITGILEKKFFGLRQGE